MSIGDKIKKGILYVLLILLGYYQQFQQSLLYCH